MNFQATENDGADLGGAVAENLIVKKYLFHNLIIYSPCLPPPWMETFPSSS